VGFVSAHFHSHSNWKIPIKGWIGQLDRTRFQIFGYHVGERRDAETDVAKRMCHQFIEGARTVENWRQQIVVDEVDVLIYPGLFMDRISTQLAAQRLAPVQCNSWGHPDTSGMPTLDFFLSSDLMEPAGATAHYTEELVRLPNLSIYCEPIELAPSMMTRGQLAIRDDASVFWCGQSTQKYLPQDDQVFIRIAQQVPNSQFLFLHHQYLPSASRLLQHRLDVAFASAGLRGRDHCVFLDALSFPDYIATMGICDVFLDSLGWSGCNSTLESLTHNLPVVTLPSGLMRGRHSAAILRMMGVTETIARTVDEYVAIAARLGNNPAERLWLRDAIARQKYRIYRDRACIEALEDFLEREGRPCGGSRPL
jgi:predicted O-linked N-acetylglucosamine transferase (SPINDLY family)